MSDRIVATIYFKEELPIGGGSYPYAHLTRFDFESLPGLVFATTDKGQTIVVPNENIRGIVLTVYAEKTWKTR